VSFVLLQRKRLLGEGAPFGDSLRSLSASPTEDGFPRPSSPPQRAGSLEKELSAVRLTEDGLPQCVLLKVSCRNNCFCLRRPHFCVDRNGGKNQPRPHKLHIVCFRLKPKARSFRCSSSPQQTRFAGLCRGPEAAFGNRGAPVSEDVCLWSALTVVFYSRSLSPPGFAANVLLRCLLCPDRSVVRR
jgi:hypothetical protein